ETVGATLIGLVQPWNPDARADRIAGGACAQAIDGADDLVPGNNAGFLRRQLALNYVKVGPADTAGVNSNQNFLFAGLGHGKRAQLEPVAFDRTGALKHAGFHDRRITRLSLSVRLDSRVVRDAIDRFLEH